MSCINVCVIARTQFRALKDAVDAGHPVAVVSDVAAVGDLDAQLFDHAGLLGAGEAHGQQYQLAGDPEVAARDFVEDDTAGLALHFHLDHVQFPEIAMFVTDELDIDFYGFYYVRVIGIFRE